MRASVAAWLLLVAGCLAALAVASSASDASGTTGDDTLDTLGSLMQHVRAWSEDRPVAAAAGGVLVIAFFIVVPVPTTPIELSLGYIYGLWLGFVLIYTGKVLGSLGAFTLGRTALRPCCLRRLTRDEMLRAIALAVQREPYRICLLVRAAYMPMFMCVAVPCLHPLRQREHSIVGRSPAHGVPCCAAKTTASPCSTRRLVRLRARFCSSSSSRPSSSRSSAAPPPRWARRANRTRGATPRSWSRAR